MGGVIGQSVNSGHWWIYLRTAGTNGTCDRNLRSVKAYSGGFVKSKLQKKNIASGRILVLSRNVLRGAFLVAVEGKIIAV